MCCIIMCSQPTCGSRLIMYVVALLGCMSCPSVRFVFFFVRWGMPFYRPGVHFHEWKQRETRVKIHEQHTWKMQICVTAITSSSWWTKCPFTQYHRGGRKKVWNKCAQATYNTHTRTCKCVFARRHHALKKRKLDSRDVVEPELLISR